ncbi:MAG TPA: hypothetical protein VF435_00950, partial [Pyrinomonadaceae bacterium]
MLIVTTLIPGGLFRDLVERGTSALDTAAILGWPFMSLFQIRRRIPGNCAPRGIMPLDLLQWPRLERPHLVLNAAPIGGRPFHALGVSA